MNDKKIYITSAKLEQIKAEYELLKKEKAEKVKEGADISSNSEDPNSEYNTFQEELALIEKRLFEMENILHSAEVIPFTGPEDRVDIGATVVLQNNGEKENITILGRLEANPEKGIVSNESPLGQALLGRFQGEDVSVNEESAYRILEVKYNKINPSQL